MNEKWHQINRLVKQWAHSEEGPTAPEYAIMLVLIVMVAMAAITAVGQRIGGLYLILANAMPQGFLS